MTLPLPYKSTIDLENDVPITPLKPRAHKYPFEEMEVGQSFFAPKVVSVNTHYWSRVTGHTYIAREAVHKGVKGTRCWRVA